MPITTTTTIASITVLSSYLFYSLIQKNEFFPWYTRFLGIFKPKYKVQGDVAEGYEGVQQAFTANFEAGEEVGASVTVICNGELKVELYGGYSNYEKNEWYTKDTLNLVYSSSKFMATSVIAYLVDQGVLSYTQKVIEIWPEFGQNGKQDVTIADVMRHEAGIPYFDDPQPTLEVVYDHTKLKKVIENQKHLFNGERVRCYHGVTRGLILNEICRLVDVKGRSIGQIYKQEINPEFDLQFNLGLDPKDFNRRAKWYYMSTIDTIICFLLPKWIIGRKALKFDKRGMSKDAPMNQVAKFKYSKDKDASNADDWHQIELPSINGFTNSKSLAKMASAFANYGKIFDKPFISETTVNLAMSDPIETEDQAIFMKIATTLGGFGIFKFPQLTDSKGEQIPFYGWGGFGGSLVLFNKEYNFAFAYVTNACQFEFFGEGRASRLIIEAFNQCKNTLDK